LTTLPIMSSPQFSRPQSTGLGAMLVFYHKLKQKPKQFPTLKHTSVDRLLSLLEKAM